METGKVEYAPDYKSTRRDSKGLPIDDRGWPVMEVVDLNPRERSAELDRAIAERIMGWQRVEGQTALAPFAYKRPDGHIVHPYSAPKYSESIEAAMQVVEKMRERGWRVSIMNNVGCEKSDLEWSVDFAGGRTVNCLAAGLPEAICRAALTAIGEQK